MDREKELMWTTLLCYCVRMGPTNTLYLQYSLQYCDRPLYRACCHVSSLDVFELFLRFRFL